MKMEAYGDGYWEFYRVELSYAVYGVLVSNNVVIKTAPIARWMVGKLWPKCQMWIGNKRGNIQLVSRNFNQPEAE